MTQDVTLRTGSSRVDFATTIEWRESHKLLKVEFAPDIHANEAIKHVTKLGADGQIHSVEREGRRYYSA